MATDTAAIEQLRDELKRLRESQERLERAITKRSKRDDATTGKLDAIIDRLDAIKSAINSPSPEQLLALTVVCTSLTAIAMGSRVAYNAYQSAVQALPGQQWGEVKDGTMPGQLPPGTAGLSEEQLANAQAIISTGRSIDGITERDIQIALMTALQESSMKNLTHGDDWWFAQWGEKSDSRGLFQQRDSWGTQECRMNPECSAKLFYEALLNVPGRESMPLGAAAQAVQNSAFPSHYDKWEEQAKALLNAASTGAIAPTSGAVLNLPKPLAHNVMVPGGLVTSLYGERNLRGYKEFHGGLDIGAPEGTPIFAPIDLCIKQAVPDGDGSGYGNYLIAKPEGRDDVELIFAHNSKNIAQTGQCYDQGEAIAEVGNSGNSTGAHLHVELKDVSGKSSPDGNMPWSVDPGPWFGVTAVEWGK